MRDKTIRLSDFEYEQVKKVRELLLKKGIDSLICPNCGWKPENVDFTYGGTINVGVKFLLHIIDNPKCLKLITSTVEDKRSIP